MPDHRGQRSFDKRCDGFPPPTVICETTEKARDRAETRNKDIEALCAAKGMRMTEQRRVIARVLAAAEDHPDVEELYRRCSAIDDRISISTVYRTVKLFEDAGIIERHDFRDGRARYEQMPEAHHDHLINLRTGEVIEFQSEEIERLQAEVARQARLPAGRPPAGALRACRSTTRPAARAGPESGTQHATGPRKLANAVSCTGIPLRDIGRAPDLVAAFHCIGRKPLNQRRHGAGRYGQRSTSLIFVTKR